MKNKTRRGITILMLILQVFAACSITGSAEPTVEISPQHPKPQDTITFNATISNFKNIEKVVIIVEECGNEPGLGYICYTDGFNKTMSATNNDAYNATITLKHKNAIELKYRLGYLTDNGWRWEPPSDENMVKVELDTSSGSTNDNDKSSESPGFEIILVLSTIFILLILYRRKR